MTCPVCQTPATAEALACRQCDADLRGLRLLAQLQTHLRPASAPAPPVPRPVGWFAAFTGGALLVGALAGWQLHPWPAPPDATAAVAVSAQPQAPRDSARREGARGAGADSVADSSVAPTNVSAAPAASAETSDPAPAGTYTYRVRRGDTLRRIAWQLYGRSSLAPRLQELNHIRDPRRLQVGQQLRVFTL